MARAPIHFRLRERRKELGLTQAALAARIGISASYLNLIEHGKRMVAGALLRRLAEALAIDLGALTGAEDARLSQEISEIAADALVRDLGLAASQVQDFVGRDRGWAQAIVRLHRSYSRASDLAQALADRLAHDARLVEASHDLLTRITAIRSFAEILREHGDLDADRRDRFTALIAEESGRLGDVAKGLFDHLSGAAESARPTTPAEEVDDFFIDRGNHFPALEAVAEALAAELWREDEPRGGALRGFLAERHGVGFEPSLGGGVRFDASRRVLSAPEGMPQATLRFQLARSVIEFAAPDEIARLAEDKRLTTPVARDRAVNALLSYGAGALLFPYAEFHAAAEATRYDIDALARRFGASMEQVCHRLVTLRRPEAEGIPFAFLRVDPAGNISKRFSLPTLTLPRNGGACPLWAVYRAFQAPETIAVQRVRLPDQREFLFVARSISKPAAGFGQPRESYSVMIGCEAIHADRIVYGDGLFGAPSLAIETGVNCYLCPRLDCAQRAHPPVLLA